MQIFYCFIEDLIRNISGPLGFKIRYYYYKRRLFSLGEKVRIDTGVFFVNPTFIIIGDNTWVDKGCILIAGIVAGVKASKDTPIPAGILSIGSDAHLGIHTIIQAHSGVRIGNYFTSSANCSIYSFSNNPSKCKKGTGVSYMSHDPMRYFAKPVDIGENVWLGLGVSLLSTNIGNDVFILPHSVVYRPITENSVAGGNPAIRLRNRFEK